MISSDTKVIPRLNTHFHSFSLIPFSSMGIMMTCAFTVGLKVDFYHFFLITMGEITAKHYKSGPLYQEDKSRISNLFH